MARNKGTFKFAASLEVQAASALDPRIVVETKAELINKETWPYDGETIYVYKGLQVAVTEELAVYMLVDVDKILSSDYSGWKRIDASAASVIEVIDNLTSENANAALSAKQGKALNDKIAALSSKLTAIFTFKGSKDNLDAIQAVESPSTGDVYHNSDNGGEYVYDGAQWELLGLSVDLAPYAKTEAVTAAVNAAKESLTSDINNIKTDLQGKIDTKVDAAEGKSLVEDTLISQITQNKTDIAALTATVSGKAAQSELDVLKTTVEGLTTDLTGYKVKDVDATASNGISLNLSDSGVIGVTVDPASLTPEIKKNLTFNANEIKLSAPIGGTAEAPNYAADSTIQAVLSGIDSRIKANADSIKAAVAGGVTSITAGDGITVDTTGEAGTTQPKVSVKVNDDSNLRVTAAGIDLVWLE